VRSLIVAGLAVTLSVSLPIGAEAGKQKQQPRQVTRTRAQGGPSALGGLPGTGANQMVHVQQQRAQRGAVRQRRMSAREQIIAARERQDARNAGIGFSSRHEAAAYTRMRARVIQLRTFAVAIAVGIGSGFFAKMVSAMGALQHGFHNLPGDPNWGNPMAQVLDHHFLIGSLIGAGATLVIGSARAAYLRHRAGAIERGEVDLDID
jgi:hypothetical protein